MISHGSETSLQLCISNQGWSMRSIRTRSHIPMVAIRQSHLQRRKMVVPRTPHNLHEKRVGCSVLQAFESSASTTQLLPKTNVQSKRNCGFSTEVLNHLNGRHHHGMFSRIEVSHRHQRLGAGRNMFAMTAVPRFVAESNQYL